MATQRYLFVYRTLPPEAPPSPTELQQMFAKWEEWKQKFKKEIVDIGDGLRPGGKIVRQGQTTDGPFIEAKEVLAGYSIVAADNIERALEVAHACPVVARGGNVEIRELAGY